MEGYEQDLKKSNAIMRLAAPIVKDLLLQIPNLFEKKNILLYTVENKDTKLLYLLDKYCGIDYVAITKEDNKAIALAWRAIKFNKTKYPRSKVYNGFSVRLKRNTTINEKNCERYKRQEAINRGLIYPQYTVQAHFDPTNDELLSIAIAKTEDIYKALDDGLWRECNPNQKEKDVYFVDVIWDKMKEKGYPVYDWYKDDSCKGYPTHIKKVV